MAEAAKSESNSSKKFKVNDRVRRSNGQGCSGVVKDIRSEVTSAGHREDKEKNVMINVQWDNGTLSYFSPMSLELAKN